VSSNGAALAATMASGCKRTSRKQKEKPKPSASLPPMRVGFTFCWRRRAEELLLCWDWLEKLMFDASVEPKLFMGSFVNCVKLYALMRLCLSRIFKEKQQELESGKGDGEIVKHAFTSRCFLAERHAFGLQDVA
jgi:hypothetical protein